MTINRWGTMGWRERAGRLFGMPGGETVVMRVEFLDELAASRTLRILRDEGLITDGTVVQAQSMFRRDGWLALPGGRDDRTVERSTAIGQFTTSRARVGQVAERVADLRDHGDDDLHEYFLLPGVDSLTPR